MEDNYKERIINDALRYRGYYPLRAMQLWLVDTHFNKAKSTMMNIGAFLKLSPQIDLSRLAQAVNDTLNNCDIFRCRLFFHPATNDICQRFDGEIIPVQIEKISDEEFERRKKELLRPYPLINKPLYRIYLFETPTAKYWYADFYHAIMDGTSAGILFFREVDMRYKGKKISRTPLNYADYILEELKVSPEELAEGNKFWREMLAGFDETKHLPPADIEAEDEHKQNYILTDLKNITQDYFSKSKRKEHIFFLAAAMLAIAKSAGAKSSILDWVHNGRYTMQESRLMGAMLEQFPISWDFEKDITVAEFLDGLAEKINVSFKYRRSLGTAYSSGLQENGATFIFQKKILGALNSVMLGGLPAEIVEVPVNQWSIAENTLDIEVNLNDSGGYIVEFAHDSNIYSEAAIKNFADTFYKIVLQLQDENILISKILG